MDKKVHCSIVMATYNGELYIREQMDSILKNMSESDELLISDDGSVDATREIITTYLNNDSRITLIDGPHKGVISNFEHVLKHAKGEIIFLCDQDDIWTVDKKEKVLAAMTKEVTLVLHDAVIFQNDEVVSQSFMQYRGSRLGLANNIIKNSYIGCCMAFKRGILDYALPFPRKICMHDQWLGLVSEIYGKNVLLEDKLLQYRRHGNNASPMTGQNLIKKIKDRFFMIGSILLLRIKNVARGETI